MTDATPKKAAQRITPTKVVLEAVDENFQMPPNFAALPAQEQLDARATSYVSNGIKEGRRRERGDILAQVGRQTIEDITAIAFVREEHDQAVRVLEAKHEREVARAARAAFWKGGALIALPAAAIVAVLMMAVGLIQQDRAFRASSEFQERAVFIEGMRSAAGQRDRNEQ